MGEGHDLHQVGPVGDWFDTSVYVLPGPETFGNAGVGTVRGPGMNVTDVAFTKKIPLFAAKTIDLRIEAYNVLNTPVFNAPDRSITSSTFGKVLSTQLAREVQLAVRARF